jgi:hypothetical protein
MLVVGAFPSPLKRRESFPPTQRMVCVRPQSDGFIEEKQLSVTPRRYYGALPAPEFQTTGDPTPAI